MQKIKFNELDNLLKKIKSEILVLHYKEKDYNLIESFIFNKFENQKNTIIIPSIYYDVHELFSAIKKNFYQHIFDKYLNKKYEGSIPENFNYNKSLEIFTLYIEYNISTINTYMIFDKVEDEVEEQKNNKNNNNENDIIITIADIIKDEPILLEILNEDFNIILPPITILNYYSERFTFDMKKLLYLLKIWIQDLNRKLINVKVIFLLPEDINIDYDIKFLIDSAFDFYIKYVYPKKINLPYKKINKNFIKLLKFLYDNYDFNLDNFEILPENKIKESINLLKSLFKIDIKFFKIKNQYFFVDKNFKLLDINLLKKEYYLSNENEKVIKELIDYINNKIKLKYLSNFSYETIANIILTGPTGTWKTFLVEKLAEQFNNNLVIINSETLIDKISFTSIFGSPPSYVWFDKLLPWQEKIIEINKNNEMWILLFDEIEKMDKQLVQSLLNILDKWYIILNNWKVLKLNKFIIFFTSNLIQKEERIGFSLGNEEIKQDNLKQKLNNHFSKEFLWRIDKVVYLEPIQDANWLLDFLIKKYYEKYKKFIKLDLKKIKEELKKENITINQDNIRYIKRFIEQKIINFINL